MEHERILELLNNPKLTSDCAGEVKDWLGGAPEASQPQFVIELSPEGGDKSEDDLPVVLQQVDEDEQTAEGEFRIPGMGRLLEIAPTPEQLEKILECPQVRRVQPSHDHTLHEEQPAAESKDEIEGDGHERND